MTSPHAPPNKFNEARKKLQTKIVSEAERTGPPEIPPKSSPFQLIRYASPVGELAAYITKDSSDGQRHPAIVWITGGDSNTIGDVWSPGSRDDDQSASAFRKAGIVMMFPSLRGGNDNPGVREGFLGEVDDILAATDHLAKLPYVDPRQIYLGGHSTGGTLAMLVGAASDRYRAIFALGPVAFANQYGGDFVYGDTSNRTEIVVRSPSFWLDSIQSPLFVIEGESGGNWSAIRSMQKKNKNPQIHFLKVPRKTHFSVIAPVVEKLAPQIVAGQVSLTEEDAAALK
jgi:dipeptidyl aminopeptidase/acylaminoacyl peptidase